MFINQLYIFGGVNDKFEFLNDLWCFDHKKIEWKKINPITKISKRYGHCSIVKDKYMFIFGGETKNLKNDFEKLNVKLKEMFFFLIFSGFMVI